jgi:uncharacterized membrane-anchored protein
MSDDPVVMAVLATAWVVLGLTVVVSGVLAARRPRARTVGRVAVAVLFLAAGAAVNAMFLLTGADYDGFADGSPIAFVRDTWQSLVVPRHELFIWLLVVFEAAVGVGAAVGGRATQVAYVAAIAFHVALMSFGVGFWVWSLPMIVGLVLLLRAERRGTSSTPSSGRAASHRPVART